MAQLASALRPEAQARVIVEAWAGVPLVFEYDRVMVRLKASPSVLSNGHLSVFVAEAVDRGVQMKLDGAGHYTWWGPEWRVHDGTWTRVSGVDVPNTREDPLEALRVQLVHVLRATQ